MMMRRPYMQENDRMKPSPESSNIKNISLIDYDRDVTLKALRDGESVSFMVKVNDDTEEMISLSINEKDINLNVTFPTATIMMKTLSLVIPDEKISDVRANAYRLANASTETEKTTMAGITSPNRVTHSICGQRNIDGSYRTTFLDLSEPELNKIILLILQHNEMFNKVCINAINKAVKILTNEVYEELENEINEIIKTNFDLVFLPAPKVLFRMIEIDRDRELFEEIPREVIARRRIERRTLEDVRMQEIMFPVPSENIKRLELTIEVADVLSAVDFEVEGIDLHNIIKMIVLKEFSSVNKVDFECVMKNQFNKVFNTDGTVIVHFDDLILVMNNINKSVNENFGVEIYDIEQNRLHYESLKEHVIKTHEETMAEEEAERLAEEAHLASLKSSASRRLDVTLEKEPVNLKIDIVKNLIMAAQEVERIRENKAEELRQQKLANITSPVVQMSEGGIKVAYNRNNHEERVWLHGTPIMPGELDFLDFSIYKNLIDNMSSNDYEYETRKYGLGSTLGLHDIDDYRQLDLDENGVPDGEEILWESYDGEVSDEDDEDFPGLWPFIS